MGDSDGHGERPARRIIERVAMESGPHMAAGRSGREKETDPAEYWGRRIGRVLSLVLLLVLVYFIYDMVAGQG